MARMKKRYEALSKFLTEVKDVFPNIKWAVYEPTKEITEIYGRGFLLVGRKGIFEKEYFILIEDPRRMEWAAMVSGELESEVENASR